MFFPLLDILVIINVKTIMAIIVAITVMHIMSVIVILAATQVCNALLDIMSLIALIINCCNGNRRCNGHKWSE